MALLATQQVTTRTWNRGDPIAPSHHDAGRATLVAATERAAEKWRDLPAFVGNLDVSDLPASVVAAVTKDNWEEARVDSRLRSAPGRRLLDLIRAELLQTWAAGETSLTADEVLRVLQAIESVRGPAESDSPDDFVDQLAGYDGVELLTEIAHDLRSPLTSILFLAEALQRRLSGDVNELQHRQLGLIYSAALGLSEMASNVLELIRGGTRLAEDEPQPFSVREIIESVLDITRPMAEEKGLIVRRHPPTNDHRLGHPIAISRVLLNLTTNALKYTERGFVEIVARETAPDRIEYSVRDTGAGMEPDTVQVLFSPFRSGPGGRMKASSTGLGLALCRRLVTAMGSELFFETKPEWGTRFYFELHMPPTPQTGGLGI